MDEPAPDSTVRLDSWKAIAAYLKRDVRTARRWESRLGLPVRRVPGGRGSSVFAYTSEIDAWLRESASREASQAAAAAPDRDSVPKPDSPPVLVARPRGLAVAVAAGVVVAASLGAWWVSEMRATELPPQIEVRADAIIAKGPAGDERWRYPPAGTAEVARVLHDKRVAAAVFTGEQPEVVAAVQAYLEPPGDRSRNGELLSFTLDGTVQRRFAFDDRVSFGGGDYLPPWTVVDYAVDRAGAGRQVAVVAHHYTWWPSLVTVLDGSWQRAGTFTHAGWVERVHWQSPDRLVIAGFSQPLDGGMIALLDTQALEGQGPVAPDTPFFCGACGDGRPLKYVVMPRTEINLVTGSRFNRAVLEVVGDRLVARTIEAGEPGAGRAIDVLYEFTPALDLVRAEFSARYWDEHRTLELQGRLDHSREECPDRHGPRLIHVWSPAAGWISVDPR